MKIESFFLLVLMFMASTLILKAQSSKLNDPIIDSEVVFEEKGGIVAVEAEYFYKQSQTEIRQWFRTSKNDVPSVGRDDDEEHSFGASNKTYIEILPDTRVTHSDKLMHGDNFSNDPGKLAIAHYKVKINKPGRYYVWVRAMSTGGEDNGIHVGLNDTWPDHGQRMQWCDGKGQWTWASKQRTKKMHCGVPKEIYLDIEKAGIHDIQFSMREDGFEFDKFILTTDSDYVPVQEGPEMFLSSGVLPQSFHNVTDHDPEQPDSYFTNISGSIPQNKAIRAQDFLTDGTHFYKHGKNWLAINPNKHQQASTSTTFSFESGFYDIVFVGVGENDGQSSFKLLINDKEVGAYQPPLTIHMFEEGKDFNSLWENISIKKGDKITVTARVGTDGNEYTRGRWAGLIFTSVGKGKNIQDAASTYTAQ